LYFKRDFKIKPEKSKQDDFSKVTASTMEGKLKEKLESLGIAFLCMGISKQNSNQLGNGCNYKFIYLPEKTLII
jgi:hypothetical protein